MGDKEDAPAPPDMSGVTNVANQIAEMGIKLGQEQLEWAKATWEENKGKTNDIVNSILSDSDAARAMADTFHSLGEQAGGFAQAARDITARALGQTDRANAIADTQGDIQQKQLGVQDQLLNVAKGQLDEQGNQLGIQQKQLGVQDSLREGAQDQLGVQQKQLGVQDAQLGVEALQLGEQQRQLGYQADQLDRSAAMYDEYGNVYQPAKQNFMTDANNYDTPGRRDQVRGAAQAAVGQQFDAARSAAQRQLEGYGVDPSETRFAALDIGTRAKEAAAKAAAGNTAALTNEERGLVLRQQAIAMGEQLPGQANAAAQTGAAYGGLANTAASNAAGFANAANSAGSNAYTAGGVALGYEGAANQAAANATGAANTALGFGNSGISAANVGANYGSLANTAGSNQISATNAATGAVNAATGATQAGTGATQAGTQAATGELASSTAAGGLGGAASAALNADLSTGASAMGSPTSYLGVGLGGNNSAANITNAGYQNEIEKYKADQASSSSGIGSLLGTVAGIGLKAYGLAEGGAVPATASPTLGQRPDDVPAQLTAGEFIIPQDAVSWYGEKFFQNLIAKAQSEKGKAGAKPAVGAPTGPPAVISRPGPAIGAM